MLVQYSTVQYSTVQYSILVLGSGNICDEKLDEAGKWEHFDERTESRNPVLYIKMGLNLIYNALE